jgi:hypothetical protein
MGWRDGYVSGVTRVMTRDAAPASPPPGRPRGVGVVLIVVAIVATLVIGAVVWFALRDTGPSEPAAFDSACGTVIRAHGSERLRALLIGDSIMAQPSCELATILAGEGVETHMHAIPGSGLLTGGVDAVRRRIDRLVDAVDPDIVLALYIGNYVGPPVLDFAGQPVAADTPLFDALWQRQARMVSDKVRDAGADLYWVEPPPMRDGGRAARVFGGYASLGDHTLPSGSSLAGPDGQWVAAKGACGNGEPLRSPDGVHLSPFGAHVFALAIAHDLDVALGRPAPAPVC